MIICFLIAEKNSSGKDEAADNLVSFLGQDDIEFDVVSFSTPVIQAYMGVFDEHRFDFYKKHPHKRDHLLEFSTFAKRNDKHIFVRKTANFINKIIDRCTDRHVIIIPDCRHLFEMQFLKEHCNISEFMCINVSRDSIAVVPYADREPQYEVPTHDKFIDEIGDKWFDVKNNDTLLFLRSEIFNIYRNNIL